MEAAIDNLCSNVQSFEFKDTGEGNGASLQRKVFEHNERHSNGGLKWSNESELKKQRSVMWDAIKSMNLVEGTDLANTSSLPLSLVEERSFLEKLTDLFAYAPRYLRRAAYATDPVERMKYVVAFAVSGLHLMTANKKPSNPILGETYQAKFFDGTDVVCEQTSDHPPSCFFEVTTPHYGDTTRGEKRGGEYHYHGSCTWSATCRGNSVKGYQKGKHTVEFEDGSRVTYTLPGILVRGVMWGERIMEYSGTMSFVDRDNNISCELEFNPEGSVGAGIKRLVDLVKFPKNQAEQKELLPSDWFSGRIYRSASTKRSKDIICNVEGSWLSHLEIDGTKLWELHMYPSGVIPLPSDRRLRNNDVNTLSSDDHLSAKHKTKQQQHDDELTKEGIAQS